MLTIKWSEQEICILIDERRRKNTDYYRIFGRSKVQFWNEVAAKIKEDMVSDFTRI